MALAQAHACCLSRRSCARLALVMAVALWAKRAYPKATFIRLLKRLLGTIISRLLPVPIPEMKSGRGSVGEIGGILKQRGCTKPLIVTDEMLVKFGVVQKCLDSVQQAGCKYEIFDKVVPNPPSELVEQGSEVYKASGCDCIVAFGGGSPMDTAKVIGAKISNPRPVKAYEGFFKATLAGLRPIPPFVAVPTTAGTGSETTVAAIITITEESRKVMVADTGLVPQVAVLDPEVLEKLPPHITAATGMDALTHAVEAYLSGWSTAYTRQLSLQAVGKIFCHLETCFKNGSDLFAREQMLQASYEAGLAFTRANIGYVHAIAHQLGGMFHTPHGDANAMLLPFILDFYLADEANGGLCTTQLCELAVAGKLAEAVPMDSAEKCQLAQTFISQIRDMNTNMRIPAAVAMMKATDVSEVASRALQEAHGEKASISSPFSWITDLGYPTPKYMTQLECEAIVEKILPTRTMS